MVIAMAEKLIYFDNAASTRVDPRVVSAMLPYFSDGYGNASSLHLMGRQAKAPWRAPGKL